MADKSKAEKDPEKGAEAANARVQEEADQAEDQGYRGSVPDPTPNENYTVAGVAAGKPTPETDEKLAAKAQEGIYGSGRGRRV